MKAMVVSVSPTAGIKCQVGDFSVVVDPSTKQKSAAGGGNKKEKDAQPGADSASVKKGRLVLSTETNEPFDSFLSQDMIDGPGEYEISGVRVRGINLGGDGKSIKTAYSAEFDDIRLAFLIDLPKEPSGEVLDRLGEVDMLFISADSKKLNSKQLATLIKQIDPRIVIPLSDAAAKKLAEELGQKVKAEEKFVIKKKDLLSESTTHRLVWLKTK